MQNSTAFDMPEPPASNGALHDLQALTHMLAEGWRIEAPVLARLAWAKRRSGHRDYHIILIRAPQRSLIVIPANPELDRFLLERNILVV